MPLVGRAGLMGRVGRVGQVGRVGLVGRVGQVDRVRRIRRVSSMKRVLTLGLLIAATVYGTTVAAQEQTFKARLAPVPVANTRDGITGSGSATATLNGRSLAVRGTFEGMQTAATIAQLHLGQRGVRGPVMFDLTVTKATNGTVTGTFTLSPEQVEAVKLGRFYVQIHSEKAPDGNLWGWLLTPK